QLTGGGPAVRGANGSEDLESDAVLAERLDPLHPRRLEESSCPVGIAGEPSADVVDDIRGLVDVGAIGNGDVLVDPGPDSGEVRGDGDGAVRDAVDDAVEVPECGPPEAEIFD